MGDENQPPSSDDQGEHKPRVVITSERTDDPSRIFSENSSPADSPDFPMFYHLKASKPKSDPEPKSDGDSS